jgi:nanoRNase/pAp phosphatase (c-di-AMP/oligoRNAs hydrolase)
MSENQIEALSNVIAGKTSVLIIPHNDPDPDAIAAAVALSFLLKNKFNMESRIAYRGLIGRTENKALIEYLGNPLQHLQQSDMLPGEVIAIVDTQPSSGNISLPKKWGAAIVIDHHAVRSAAQDGQFVDIRPDIGSTSTILTNYLLEAGIEPSTQIATALFFGIKTDTMGLSRNASQTDVNAYIYLQTRIDVNALAQIEQAQVPLVYFQSLDNAIHASRVYDKDTIIAFLGTVHYPDLGAEIADLFMRLKGIQWVLCMGVFRDELILSVRSRNKDVGAGKLVSAIIGDRGTAGGHGSMAAGHIILRFGDDPEQLAADLAKAMLLALKGTHDVEFKLMI